MECRVCLVCVNDDRGVFGLYTSVTSDVLLSGNRFNFNPSKGSSGW